MTKLRPSLWSPCQETNLALCDDLEEWNGNRERGSRGRGYMHIYVYTYQSVSSVSQFSHSVVCDSLQPHGMQHARLPCPSPTPEACSNSCPSSQWCHPTISFSVIPFSSCLPSFPASGSFPMSQFFASDGQSIGASASASVLPVNIQDWFPLGLIDLINQLYMYNWFYI